MLTYVPGMYACVSPQATILSLIVTPYHPDTAIHHESSNMAALLELTFSLQQLESARDHIS